MKKIYLLIVAFAANSFYLANAQCLTCTNYQFTKTTGTYANIAGGTSVSDGQSVAIGFPFYHYGVRFDTMLVNLDGWAEPTSDVANVRGTMAPFLTWCEYDPNFMDSGIRSKVSGSPGSRQFVVEWRSMAIDYPGTASPNSDHVNFQLVLFEGTNVFEFRYGSSLVTDLNGDFSGESGPQIYHDIFSFNTFQERSFWLHDNVASPTTYIDYGEGDPINGVPSNGTIYRFTPTTISSVSDLQTAVDFSVFPNPASNAVTIVIDETMIGATATITDVAGRTVAAVNLTTVNRQLTTESFANGVYFVTVTDKEGRSTAKKLVISK